MSNISVNIAAVNACASKLRSAAETVYDEGRRIDNIIVNTQNGWQGAGARQFMQYLQEMKKDIAEREQNLSSLADRLTEAAKRAAAADEAAKSAMTGSAMAGTSVTGGVCPPKN